MSDEPRDEDDGKCDRCHVRPAEPLHPCPYRYEIDYDSTTMCNCCPECRSNCADDI